MNFYISDLHFGHKNVLFFDNRPFDNIDEMAEALIENWNRKVGHDDDVWILGDFCYRSDKDPSYFLKQLNGRKHLLIGNHDKVTLESKSAYKYFESVERLQHIKDGNNNVILCHFPIAEWNAMKRGAFHIYGHIHGNQDVTFQYMKQFDRALNAGCMINNYEPVTLDELIVNNKKFKQESL